MEEEKLSGVTEILPAWVLGVCGLAVLGAAVLPWADTAAGKLFLWKVASDPTLLGLPLTSPPMVKVLLYALPVLGLAYAVIWTLREKEGVPARSWEIWTAAGLTALALVIAGVYNPALTRSAFEVHHSTVFGAPLTVVCALAAGGLWAVMLRPDNVFARRLAVAAAGVVLVAAVMPHYHLGERSIPLVGQLGQLGKGGSASLQGATAILTWIAAGVALFFVVTGQLDPGRAGSERGSTRSIAFSSVCILAGSTAANLLVMSLSGTHGLTRAVSGVAMGGLSVGLAWCAARICLSQPVAGTGPGAGADTGADRRADWHAHPRVANTLFWIAAALTLFAYFALETQAVGYTVTDENIYFYQAWLLSKGEVVYRDFFFAHPPVHILIPAFFFKLFGFSLTLAKMISTTAQILTGVCVLLSARRLMGRLPALCAMMFYLFAFAVLNAGNNLTGINLTVLFVMAGVYSALAGRPLRSGVFLGLALSTGFYSAAAVAALMVLALLRPRRFSLSLVGGTLGVWLAFNLFFLALAGGQFLSAVYFYHGRKLPQDMRHMDYFGEKGSALKALFYNVYVLFSGKEFKKTFFYHGHLIWGAMIALFTWLFVRFGYLPASPGSGPATTGETAATPLWKRALALVGRRPEAEADKKAKGGKPAPAPGRAGSGWFMGTLIPALRKLWDGPDNGVMVVFLIAAALVAQFSMLKRVYSFYFVLWYPLMGILLAYVLQAVVRGLADAAAPFPAESEDDRTGSGKKGRGSKTAGPRRSAQRVVAAALAVGLFASFYTSCENWAHKTHESEFAEKGKRIDYPWRKPKFAKSLGPVVKAVFWKNHRIRGQSVPGLRQFIWNKSRHFVTAPEIAAHIRANTKPGETIAGASAIAPLLAILSGRRIADNFVDTNTLRFRSGLVTEEKFYKRICKTRLAYLVSAPRSFFSWRKMRHHSMFLETFKPEKVFNDPQVRFGGKFPVILLRRTTDATSPPYCKFTGRSSVPRALRMGQPGRRRPRRRTTPP